MILSKINILKYKRFLFLLIILLFTGCASYKIPVQIKDHPASADISVFPIELSPILDISEKEVGNNDIYPYN